MRGCHDRPEPRLVERDGREDHGLGEHALLQQPVAEPAGRGRVAHHHRCDRRLGDAGIEAEPGEFGLEPTGIRPETFDEFRLVLEDLDRGDARSRDGGWVRCREEERPRAVVQELDQVAAAAHVSAQHADRLGERPHLNVHASIQAEVIDGAAPVAPEHAGRVRVVDEDRRPELLGRLDDPGEWRDVAVHAEHAVRHDKDQPVWVATRATVGACLRQGFTECRDVLVRIDHPRRLAHAHAVDDRGVVQGVRDDQVGR